MKSQLFGCSLRKSCIIERLVWIATECGESVEIKGRDKRERREKKCHFVQWTMRQTVSDRQDYPEIIKIQEQIASGAK
jgi:hypothetical protein